MNKQKESNPFLMDSILDDDAKDSFKDAITNARVHNYSAPPTMMTLYDYDLSKQLFGEEQKEKPKKKIVKPTVIKSSANKVSQQNNSNQIQQQTNFQQSFKYPQQPTIYGQQRQQTYYQNYPYLPVLYVPYTEYDYQYHQSMYQKQVKQKQYDINELLPLVSKMSKDRNGSRTIQNYIQVSSDEEKDLIFQQLMKEAIVLIKDQFGNYVFQKIFEVGLNKHKKKILQTIKGRICQLSYNTFGCRVVQKALEFIRNINEQQDYFISQLKNQIVNLVQDQNGNHVIQKCFECCSAKKTQCIIQQMIQNIQKLAFHAYGCRVIQKFLENSKTEKSNEKTKTILKKLIQMIIPLCKCQYGNYIMQYIVQNGPLDEKNSILITIKNNFIPLSLDKFASNVVEKAIRCSNDNYRKELLNTLQQPFQGTEIGLVVLAQGQYANYVIQRFLEYSDRQTQKNIMSLISENSHNYNAIKESQYGKHVLSQIQRFR